MANKISTLIEFETANAKSGLAGFKSSVAEAEGGIGKFKAGISSLGSTLGSFLSGPGGVAVAGGAIAAAGKFALDSVNSYSQLGVEVGKLHDSTGLLNTEASRWIEVAGDIGISADTVESSLGKLNKTAGSTPQVFADAGIAIAHTKDGAVDVNQTFLNTIDVLNGIADPQKKAALAAKILGRGWQSMAEIIGQGSGKLKKSLADVADVKVFDDEKVQKSRDFRAAMDSLKDSAEEFALTVGQDLIPVMTDLAKVTTTATSVWGKFHDGVLAVRDRIDETALNIALKFNPNLETTASRAQDARAALAETERETAKLGGTMGTTATDFEHAGIASHDLGGFLAVQSQELYNSAKAAGASQRATDNLTASWDLLKSHLSDKQQWIDIENSFDDVKQKGIDAFDAHKNHSADAEQKARDYQSALLDLDAKVIDYAKDVGGLPLDVTTMLQAEVDAGSITTANQLLDEIAHARQVIYNAQVAGHREFASGTTNAPAGLALVGERGPELMALGGGERIYPANQTAAMLDGGGGGNVYNNTIVMPTGINDRDLARALGKMIARNGPAILNGR